MRANQNRVVSKCRLMIEALAWAALACRATGRRRRRPWSLAAFGGRAEKDALGGKSGHTRARSCGPKAGGRARTRAHNNLILIFSFSPPSPSPLGNHRLLAGSARPAIGTAPGPLPAPNSSEL